MSDNENDEIHEIISNFSRFTNNYKFITRYIELKKL